MSSGLASRSPASWAGVAVIAAAAAALILGARETLGVGSLVVLLTQDPATADTAAILASFGLLAIAMVLPPRIPWVLRTGAVAGAYLAAAAFVVLGTAGLLSGGGDAWILYSHGLPDPYAIAYEDLGFAYSPAVAQALYPPALLPWGAFLGGWTALIVIAMIRMAGPMVPLLMLAPYVALDVYYANINLLIAYAIVAGLSRPAWWALVLHTKVTPGVGLIWFLVRREWIRLGIAVGVTCGLAGVSLVLAPHLWSDWLGMLGNASTSDGLPSLGPLWIRVVVASLVVAWGGLTSRPWTVAAGALLAVPVPWPATITLLVAVIPLARRADSAARLRAVDRALQRRTA